MTRRVGLLLVAALLAGHNVAAQADSGAARPSVLVRAGRLIAVRTGTVLTNQAILIEGDRIKEVGPADAVAGHGVRWSDLLDAVALDQNRLIREHRARAHGNEPPRAHQHAGARGPRVRLSGDIVSGEQGRNEQQAGAPGHRAPPIVFSTRCANTCTPAGAMVRASPLIS